MLKTKTVLKSTMGIALTASLFVLAGCPEQAAVTTPSGTPVASATATVAPTVAPTATPVSSSVATPVASVSGASSTPTTAPVTSDITTQQGTTPDINSKATLDGRVTDETGSLLDNVKIIAEAVGITGTTNAWKQSTTTVRGSYVFRDVPVGVVLKVSAEKSGFTSREQSIVLKSNLQGNADQNKLDFDTTDSGSTGYFLQDAPEIVKFVVNGVEATDAGTIPFLTDTFTASGISPTLANATANLTGLKNDQLKIELTFSEPVQQEEVKNFEIYSSLQEGFVPASFKTKKISNITPVIDGNTDGITFTWNSDNTQVVINLPKPLLVNSSGDEAIYCFTFGQNTLFKDVAGKSALKSKYIRFNSNTANQFVLFSLQNDSDSPSLLNVSAKDGSTDVLELTFSEKLSVQGKTSYEAELANPDYPNYGELSAWIGNVRDNASYLGFGGEGGEAYSYAIAKINESEPSLNSLFNNADAYNSGGWHMSDLSTGMIRKASFVDGNSAKVRIELDPSAFSSGDLIVVSAGQEINTTYSSTTLKSNKDATQVIMPTVPSSSSMSYASGDAIGSYVTRSSAGPDGITYVTTFHVTNIRDTNSDTVLDTTDYDSVSWGIVSNIPTPIIISDPAGNALDRGNGQTNSNVRVNNGQRAARAS